MAGALIAVWEVSGAMRATIQALNRIDFVEDEAAVQGALPPVAVALGPGHRAAAARGGGGEERCPALVHVPR